VVALAIPMALVAVGCGRSDFANNPRPAVAAEVTVSIDSKNVEISPKRFGAGLVNFTIANLTADPATLSISGPTRADSGDIPPAGNTTMKMQIDVGHYEASATGPSGVRPVSFDIATRSPSARNDLLLP
jgi:hypothetical protein